MGCGVSKFDKIAEEGAASSCYLLSPVHPRITDGDRVVEDSSSNLSKPLTIPAEKEHHAKGDDIIQHNNKNVNSERDQEDEELGSNKEEGIFDRGHGAEYPQSLSFRIYCIPSFTEDDNSTEGHTDAGHIIKDEQQGESDVENSTKGSRNRSRRRGRIRKGIKTGSAKVKSILKVQSKHQSS